MKHKTPRSRARRKATNKTSAVIKPELKKTKAEMETIARWEDDGGPTVVDTGKSVDPSKIDKNKESTDK
jgi:hypothetical protein